MISVEILKDGKKVIWCDTESDMVGVGATWSQGSLLYVIADGSLWIADSAGGWVKQP